MYYVGPPKEGSNPKNPLFICTSTLTPRLLSTELWRPGGAAAAVVGMCALLVRQRRRGSRGPTQPGAALRRPAFGLRRHHARLLLLLRRPREGLRRRGLDRRVSPLFSPIPNAK